MLNEIQRIDMHKSQNPAFQLCIVHSLCYDKSDLKIHVHLQVDFEYRMIHAYFCIQLIMIIMYAL